MFTDIQQAEKRVDSQKRTLNLHDVARTIREDALGQARSTLPPSQRDIDLQALLQEPDVFHKFTRHVATGIAEIIAANDDRVQALYLFDESVNPDAETEDDLPLDATIHLLVLVTSNSAALEIFIASLDRALTQQLNELPLEMLRQRTSILDVIAVSEDDVRNRRGYASSLLSSWYAPPIKVWAREG